MRAVTAALLLFLAGCFSAEQVGRPRQAEAIELVWQAVYAETVAPPLIEWREDFCNPAHPEKAGVATDGLCLSGRTFSVDYCLIAWRGSFADSSFTHELMHARQLQDDIWDDTHSLPEWGQMFAHPRGLLDEAQDVLTQHGLDAQ